LASLPPEVEVPLPLRLGFIELPVVGDAPGLAELAAGSPDVEPRPLGTPLCAYAKVPENIRTVANAMLASFVAASSGMTTIIPQRSTGSLGLRNEAGVKLSGN
jgi:hypothetical protein